jgi:hypothetical protein
MRNGALSLAIVSLVAALCSNGCGAVSAPAPSSAESITNNQEAGVDEGGIVKAAGEYLLVLRRGRLFTVRVGDQDLQPVSMIDVEPPGSGEGTWFDEMLVSDDTVVVVGYSYRVSATQLCVFGLDPAGGLDRRGVFYLRSNDYYSSRNYASRLVDGQLLFYMPHAISGYEVGPDGRVSISGDLPAYGAADGHGADWGQLITSSEVFIPSEQPRQPTLHTVVSCDLRSPQLRCRARGVIGGFGRTFYVSRTAVYVWITDGIYGGDDGRTPAAVYRLPLDGSTPGALRAWGAPIDQFSFSEGDDGYLNVLVRGQGGGDWMGNPERSSGGLALARFPIASFSSFVVPERPLVLVPADPGSYTPLPLDQGAGYGFQNRFVGGAVLYAAGEYGFFNGHPSTRLYVHPVTEQGETTVLELGHAVERIEALGDDAVAIGEGELGLQFTSIALGPAPAAAATFALPGASQGETRSHGFYYREEADDQGIVGLPVRFDGWRWSNLTRTSAEVLFLDVEQLRLSEIGALVAHDDRVDDECRVSCVDWYGNSRPIFYRGRIFALMGYELVEGVVRNQHMLEIGRTHMIADLRG